MIIFLLRVKIWLMISVENRSYFQHQANSDHSKLTSNAFVYIIVTVNEDIKDRRIFVKFML